ncbi:AmmeMemoRadiSam system protein A [Psychromonas sp. MME2]|uniref:AmmeMemoRadiSam system protein A n=1 Tax=unclassified Psychromonas TaxID=2614957 RepID=UPI00339BD99F
MAVSNSINLTEQEKQQLITFCKQAIQQHLDDLPFVLPAAPNNKNLLQPLPCFVTLTINDHLRGCIGTYQVDRPLWENVYYYAFCSAFEDSRFPPLQADELSNLTIEISILSALQEIPNNGEATLIDELQIGVDGLLLQEGWHKAIFLPTVWEVLPEPRMFVQHLKQKANWPKDYWSAEITLQRFTTEVFSAPFYIP